MSRLGRYRSSWRRGVPAGALALLICGCASAERDSPPPPLLAVLSAFPGELAPLLERATIDETVVVGDRVFRVGMLADLPVVLGLTGIGLVNAAATTRVVLDRFAVTGVVVSAVAGSPFRIGDVVVPEAWAANGTLYAAHREWLDLADEIASSASVSLERCTLVRSGATEEPVCLPHEPAIVVGGVGRSSDPFGGAALPCRPGGDDVFGCDVVPAGVASSGAARRRGTGALAPVDPDTAAANDMETAAIAREAAARGVPFIAFRAVSDGEGDPLGLPGFPAQFFAYYRLAARNAAAATAAFLDRLTAARFPRRGVALPPSAE